MSYYASGYGDLYLNDYALTHLDDLQSVVNTIDVFDSIEIIDNEIINITQPYSSYYEDGIYDALSKLAPFIEEDQVIEFVGEDSDHWRFRKVGNSFIEEQGYIIYK